MSMARTTRVLRYFAHLVLICSSLICGQGATFAQATGSLGGLTQEVESGSGTRSSEQARENQQQPYAQDVAPVRDAVSVDLYMTRGLKLRNSAMG